jgi:hypothetical protein
MSTSYVPGRALCILVEWGSPSNTGRGPASTAEPLTHFRLRVSGQSQDVVLPPNETAHLACGLVAGSTYAFSLAAANVAGLGPSASVSQTAIGAHPASPAAHSPPALR